MSTIPGLPTANANQQILAQERAAYQMQTDSILQQYDLSTYSEPLIDRESIYYNEDTKTFSFKYSNGVIAMVKLIPDECLNGSDEEISLTEIQRTLSSDKQSSDEPLMRAVPGDKALLIYDLDPTQDRLNRLESVRDLLLENNPSVTSTIKVNPTVPEYRTLLSGGYRTIIISSHGVVYSLNLFTNYPSVILCEITTDTKLNLYSSDLLQNRVGIVHKPDQPDQFTLLPSFFEYYYSGNKLGGAYVHLGICSGFGEGIFADNTLASKFTASGASAVTGYHGKDVFIPYDHGMINSIARNLITGKSLQSAVAIAKSVQGDTGPKGEYIIIHGNGGWTL